MNACGCIWVCVGLCTPASPASQDYNLSLCDYDQDISSYWWWMEMKIVFTTQSHWLHHLGIFFRNTWEMYCFVIYCTIYYMFMVVIFSKYPNMWQIKGKKKTRRMRVWNSIQGMSILLRDIPSFGQSWRTVL